MDERKAGALLKQRFEAAGLKIEANRMLDQSGVRFEIDGFDPDKKVGYEYLTDEAGDSWDVDGSVIATLDALREKGELYVLVIDEADAPDEAELGEAIDGFLEELRERGVIGGGAEKEKGKGKGKAKAKESKPPPSPKKTAKKK